MKANGHLVSDVLFVVSVYVTKTRMWNSIISQSKQSDEGDVFFSAAAHLFGQTCRGNNKTRVSSWFLDVIMG